MNKVILNSKPGSFITNQLRDINTRNSNKFESETKKLKEWEPKNAKYLESQKRQFYILGILILPINQLRYCQKVKKNI